MVQESREHETMSVNQTPTVWTEEILEYIRGDNFLRFAAIEYQESGDPGALDCLGASISNSSQFSTLNDKFSEEEIRNRIAWSIDGAGL